MSARSRICILSVACVTTLLALDAAADPAPVHRYSFNNGNADDSVGKSHGKLVGGVKIADGKAQFSGTAGQRIELLADGADGIKINTYKAVTFEAWYTASKNQAWQRVFDFGASAGLDSENSMGSNYLFYTPSSLFPDGTQMTRAAISNANPGYESEAVIGIPLLPAGAELHMAMTIDSGKITLFVNGTQVGQQDLEDRSLAKVSNAFALLGDSLYGNDLGLSGSINEFRIYDTALTADEVSASFAAGPNKAAGSGAAPAAQKADAKSK